MITSDKIVNFNDLSTEEADSLLNFLNKTVEFSEYTLSMYVRNRSYNICYDIDTELFYVFSIRSPFSKQYENQSKNSNTTTKHLK